MLQAAFHSLTVQNNCSKLEDTSAKNNKNNINIDDECNSLKTNNLSNNNFSSQKIR